LTKGRLIYLLLVASMFAYFLAMSFRGHGGGFSDGGS
jgi:hypothetical protein